MTARVLATCQLLVDRPRIALYAALTRDANPIHLDDAFAATTEMGGVIAHGTMSSNLLWQVCAEAGLNVMDMQVRFIAPVRPGDVLTAGGDISAAGHCSLWIRDQSGRDVVTAQAVVQQSASGA